jgi:thiol-disulfide isomerase/thioredoxin
LYCKLPLIALFMSLFYSTSAQAQEASSPIDRLHAITGAIDDAQRAAAAAFASHPDGEDPNVIRANDLYRQRLSAAYAPVFEIAKADPKSKAGFEALEWLLLQAPTVYGQPGGMPALEMMKEFHAENPKVGKAIARVGYYPPLGLPAETPKQRRQAAYVPALELLQAVAQRNPDRTARGQAVLALARQDKRAFDWSPFADSADPNPLVERAIQSFETVVREYGDCANLRTASTLPPAATLGAEAEAELFELRSLRIGSMAPDIIGDDLNAKPLKLSEYRGKVVLLVFWASWCGPCMAAVPHEREVAAHFKGRPFVLIGVNGDESREVALNVAAKNQISWRSFWNGEKGSGGPIATAWNVRGWPTVYAIDARGVIRHKDLYDKAMDEPLEKLVREAEAAMNKGG